MAKIDVYHRAFLNYREDTKKNKACASDRRTIKKLGLDFDFFKVTKYLCTIDEEWIIQIEKGLEFIEKAVLENRQFIRVNGEVVPIEKAKKISKHSVEHLAKHSNLITHLPENPNDTLIPDAIYMVEKLNDYAVYENRFLYMLLCYLRDFVALRIEKIYELRSTYVCDFALKKDYDSKKHNYSFTAEYHEERYDNPYPLPDEVSRDLLKRIEDCQQIIMMLLNTDVMVEVSKAPMLKPPIIKTNVLKMNNNFKNALALYDYIVGYKGAGYTSEEVIKDFVPFNDATADELAELVTITNYLTYKYGNEITDILTIEYNREEERRRLEEEEKLRQQIARLKKRIEESGMGVEEYILAVEKQNRLLEKDAQDLIIARNEILSLEKQIEQLESEKDELKRNIIELEHVIEEKNKEIAYLNQKYIDDMNALKKKHAEEIMELKKKHALEITNLANAHIEEIEALINERDLEIERITNEYEAELERIKDQYEAEIISLENQYNNRIDELNELHQSELERINLAHEHELNTIEERLANAHRAEIEKYLANIEQLTNQIQTATQQYNSAISSYTARINDLNNKINEGNQAMNTAVNNYEGQIRDLISKYDNQINDLAVLNQGLTTQRDLLNAEISAIRVKEGKKTPTLDFTSKERFKELEQEFEAFNNFFKKQWKLTKKQIRKKLFWTKAENKEQIINESNDTFIDSNNDNNSIE